MREILSPKEVSDPIRGVFDIRPFVPMIDTRQFQSLGFKFQLGMTFLIYRSATHMRLAHSLGAYAATTELARRWLEYGFINKDEALALCGFALYHDIGHGPFSHVTEALLPINHDENGLIIINELKDEIEACGINFELMKKLFSHESPLYLAVHDKNLGMEKLDYLERDALFTVRDRPAGIDYLRRHIYFINNELVIDKKVKENAKSLQEFYLKMYKNVYLGRVSAICQRMAQKMVYGLLLAGELQIQSLSKLNDFELMGKFASSRSHLVKSLFELLMSRNLFKEAVVICFDDTAPFQRVNKPIKVFGVSGEIMEKLVNSPKFQEKNQLALAAIEEAISRVAGIPYESILVVPIISPERVKPKDIRIYNSEKTLKDFYPAHYKNMEELGRSYLALRVCAPAKYREKLSEEKTARKVFDLILDLI